MIHVVQTSTFLFTVKFLGQYNFLHYICSQYMIYLFGIWRTPKRHSTKSSYIYER